MSCKAADITRTSFDPDTTRAMGVAFEMACRSLQLSDTADPLTKLIAAKIVDSACTGEHDAVRAIMRWAASA
jgi:hypothetical protein